MDNYLVFYKTEFADIELTTELITTIEEADIPDRTNHKFADKKKIGF